MTIIDTNTLQEEMNRLGILRQPFLWGITYDQKSGFVIPDPMAQKEVLWHIGSCGNDMDEFMPQIVPSLKIRVPLSRSVYLDMFSIIRNGLLRGDSFLANLTGATEVECSGSLRDVFLSSSAPFRLLLGDEYVFLLSRL